jgi:hypothetical protein
MNIERIKEPAGWLVKRATRALSALVLVGCLSVSAGARGEETLVVVPTGQFPADVQNVQAALDAGGEVLLRAADAAGVPTAFNFGAFGAATLSSSVTVVGEVVNGHMTTIRGGFAPFRAMPFAPVRSAFHGIRFDGPRSTAVFLNFSSGFEFTGNVVTDVIGTPYFGLTKGQAVWITAAPGHVTGSVKISGNVVERVFADLSYGVAIAGFDATAEIGDNTFRDTRDTGILVVGGSQTVSIENNLVVPGAAPYPGFFSVGNGIFVGQGKGAFRIRRNTVVCGNPFADGIALSGHIAAPDAVPASSVVEHNHVTMQGSMFGAITVYGQIDPSLIANNLVRGDGAFAMQVAAAFGNEQTRAVVFRGNNIADFKSSVANVFLDTITHENVLVGHSGTVVDLGVANRITGFTTTALSIGPELLQAQRRKRELLATLK